MGYRAFLQANHETVQDLELSAARRLDEAMELFVAGRNHTAIYLAGLSAEMYLKNKNYARAIENLELALREADGGNVMILRLELCLALAKLTQEDETNQR